MRWISPVQRGRAGRCPGGGSAIVERGQVLNDLGRHAFGQAVWVEAAGRLDYLVQARPPGTVSQRAEGMQDTRGLLRRLRRGDDCDPARPDRPQRPEVEIRPMIRGLTGTGIHGEYQVVVRQLEPPRPPRGQDLRRLLLEAGRSLLLRHIPHRPPAGGHRRQRVGGHQRVRRRSSPGAREGRRGRLQAVAVVVRVFLWPDQGHVHGPADGGEHLAGCRTGEDHHGAGITSHRLDVSRGW